MPSRRGRQQLPSWRVKTHHPRLAVLYRPTETSTLQVVPRRHAGRRAAIHEFCGRNSGKSWMPACAGMTRRRRSESQSFRRLVLISAKSWMVGLRPPSRRRAVAPLQPTWLFPNRDGDVRPHPHRPRSGAGLAQGPVLLRRQSCSGASLAQAPVFRATPLSASSVSSSPDWNISVTMSQPPTNSPFT